MTSSIDIFLQTLPFIRFLYVIFVFYSLGIVYGIFNYILLYKLYLLFMKEAFKLEPLTAGDRVFIWPNKQDDYQNILAILVLETCDIEQMKTFFIEKGIKKFVKMRSKRVYRFLDYWWEEQSLENVLMENPIQTLENIETLIYSKEDLVKWGLKELHEKIDLNRELPYKIKIVKNNPHFGSIIGFIFDHGFCDGSAFISLINALADNYDIKLFPQVNKRNIKLIERLKNYVLLPFYFVIPFYQNLFGFNNGSTPFKLEGKKRSCLTSIKISDRYELDKYIEISRTLGITFNDLIISVFSVAIKKYCQNHFSKIPDTFVSLIPISYQKLPNTLDDIIICNSSSGIPIEIKLVDNVINHSKDISRKLHKAVRIFPVKKLIKGIVDFMYTNLPHYLTKFIFKKCIRKYDMTISNVPGPRKQLLYNGTILKDLMCLMTPGFFTTFTAIVSYNNFFTITMSMDENLKVDPGLLYMYVHKELIGLIDDVKYKQEYNLLSKKYK